MTENTRTICNPEIANNTKTQQNKNSLVYSPYMTLGQETICANSTTLPSPHGQQLTSD